MAQLQNSYAESTHFHFFLSEILLFQIKVGYESKSLQLFWNNSLWGCFYSIVRVCTLQAILEQLSRSSLFHSIYSRQFPYVDKSSVTFTMLVEEWTHLDSRALVYALISYGENRYGNSKDLHLLIPIKSKKPTESNAPSVPRTMATISSTLQI